MIDKFSDIDALLNGLMKPDKQTLQALFDKKLLELDMALTNACKIIDIQPRTLKGILSGTQKLVDITNLAKLASFLQLSKEQVVKLYLDAVEEHFPTNTITPDRISFIKDNFDLAVLRKAGLLDNITDFAHIEKRLTARLGLKSIFEYRKPNVDIAFSSGNFKTENNLTRAYWVNAATVAFKEISNPYSYSREELIKLVPQLRWYTTNVDLGLVDVVKQLYKVGITVIFQQSLQTLQLRGATFSVNSKPCIALTNYVGFYPTVWFALMHELYHVLFDWEEIKANKYHLTDDSNEQLSVREREKEADDFARGYLFSREKTDQVRRFINDAEYVAEFAAENHVHPSFPYVFTARDSDSRTAWALARANSPDVNRAIGLIDMTCHGTEMVEEKVQKVKSKVYA
ncbi:MAG: hypothetical protein EOO61_04240 [Hymenobacter sp.]|nr:MAG: hypothetical protein EOO61_04240 [Hymenobacter sp.]